MSLSEKPKPPRDHPFPDDAWIESVIANLRRLEESSTPSSVSAFPPDWEGPYLKDGNATQALEDGAHLFGRMVRWAIHHRTGTAVNGLLPGAPRYIGRPPPPRKGRVKYDNKIEAEHRASEDGHEADGEAYRPGENPELDRQILGVLLKYYEPLFPRGLARWLSTSLFALNLGQTLPLLMHEGKGKHARPFERWRFQWHALLHLEFLLGLGESTDRAGAVRIVADAYGRGSAAVKAWATTVPNQNPGYDDFESAKADMRREGQLLRGLRTRSDLSDDDKQTLQRLELFEVKWGKPGIKRNGKKYRNLTRGDDDD